MNLSANIAKKYEKNKLKRIFIKKNFIFMKIVVYLFVTLDARNLFLMYLNYAEKLIKFKKM